MKNSLFILGQLSDEDVDWIIINGQKTFFKPGDILIKQEEPIEELFITIKGKFEVINETTDQQLAILGNGEILGEMSYINDKLPSATVKVLQDSIVHVIKRISITEKLAEDPYFATRFYKAMATMLSDRLRQTQSSVNDDDSNELDMTVIEKLHLAGARFERILKKFDIN